MNVAEKADIEEKWSELQQWRQEIIGRKIVFRIICEGGFEDYEDFLKSLKSEMS